MMEKALKTYWALPAQQQKADKVWNIYPNVIITCK